MWSASIEYAQLSGGESGIIYNLGLFVEDWFLGLKHEIIDLNIYNSLLNTISENITKDSQTILDLKESNNPPISENISTAETNILPENSSSIAPFISQKQQPPQKKHQQKQISLKEDKNRNHSSDSFWSQYVPNVIEPQISNNSNSNSDRNSRNSSLSNNNNNNNDILKARQKLPAWNTRDNFLNLVQNHLVK